MSKRALYTSNGHRDACRRLGLREELGVPEKEVQSRKVRFTHLGDLALPLEQKARTLR